MRRASMILMLLTVLFLVGIGPPGSHALCEWGCTGHVGPALLFLERGPGGVMLGHVGMIPIFLQTDPENGSTTGFIGKAETEIAESYPMPSKMAHTGRSPENPALWPGVQANGPPWAIPGVPGWELSFPSD